MWSTSRPVSRCSWISTEDFSPTCCRATATRLAQRIRPRYYANDARWLDTLIFDDHPEDANGNGVLDPGEDSDQDGVLDGPERQALPIGAPWRYVENTLWEADSNTLQIRPIRPLKPGRTYAVILTVGSKPRAVKRSLALLGINHPRQTATLKRVLPHLEGLGRRSMNRLYLDLHHEHEPGSFAIRAGMYGYGGLGWLHDQFPAQWHGLHRMVDDDDPNFSAASRCTHGGRAARKRAVADRPRDRFDRGRLRRTQPLQLDP